jgi:hypothetical protein
LNRTLFGTISSAWLEKVFAAARRALARASYDPDLLRASDEKADE